MGAMSAHVDGEGGRRAQLVSAVVEAEKVVEEVVRAMTRKAALQQTNVCVFFPRWARARRPDFRLECAAGTGAHVDDDWTLHPNETTARRQTRDVSHTDHKCNVCVCS